MSWDVRFTASFNTWFYSLHEDQQVDLAARLLLLRQRGPALGRPSVDSIKGSRHSNMKELRYSSAGALRVLFMFDPTRTAILLLGGDKSSGEGPRWAAWYRLNIALADRLYDEHLNHIGDT
jgi:hypothetical protein